MPGQNPNHHHDSVNTTRPTYRELPPQSADRLGSPRCPRSPRPAPSPSLDLSRGHRRKKGKKVHWDPSVVDNEQKMQSRPKKSTAAHPSKSHDGPAVPGLPASSKSATANTSEKITPSHSRQPSDKNFIQDRYPKSPPRLKHSRGRAYEPSHAGANSSSKRISSPNPKSPTKFRKTPPTAPDPPRTYHPPPAPRPARLPTPDLPEIEEFKFFVPKDKLFDFSRGRNDPRQRPIYHKTDVQLETAIAYIQERKWRGN